VSEFVVRRRRRRFYFSSLLLTLDDVPACITVGLFKVHCRCIRKKDPYDIAVRVFDRVAFHNPTT